MVVRGSRADVAFPDTGHFRPYTGERDAMQDNRCPNCENDLTDTVTASVITMLQTGERRPRAVACPHCNEPLVAVRAW